jgi:hypothetical protein
MTSTRRMRVIASTIVRRHQSPESEFLLHVVPRHQRKLPLRQNVPRGALNENLPEKQWIAGRSAEI